MLRYREALAAMLKWATRDMGTWDMEDMRAYLAYTRVWNGMGITGYTTVAAWALREAYSLWAGEGWQAMSWTLWRLDLTMDGVGMTKLAARRSLYEAKDALAHHCQ